MLFEKLTQSKINDKCICLTKNRDRLLWIEWKMYFFVLHDLFVTDCKQSVNGYQTLIEVTPRLKMVILLCT